MSAKDNPGTLPINLYLTEQPTSQPFDFGKIGEVQGEAAVTAREGQGEERSTDLVHLSGDIALSIHSQMVDHPAKWNCTF